LEASCGEVPHVFFDPSARIGFERAAPYSRPDTKHTWMRSPAAGTAGEEWRGPSALPEAEVTGGQDQPENNSKNKCVNHKTSSARIRSGRLIQICNRTIHKMDRKRSENGNCLFQTSNKT